MRQSPGVANVWPGLVREPSGCREQRAGVALVNSAIARRYSSSVFTCSANSNHRKWSPTGRVIRIPVGKCFSMRRSPRSCCSPTRCAAVANGVRSRPVPRHSASANRGESVVPANHHIRALYFGAEPACCAPTAAVTKSQAFRERRAMQHPCTGIESLGRRRAAIASAWPSCRRGARSPTCWTCHRNGESPADLVSQEGLLDIAGAHHVRVCRPRLLAALRAA